MSIKVSVIIPAYNTENYMEQCMASLVNQTLSDMEIIVVDDGSTDNTLHILKEYEAKYPGKVRALTKENGGQASARNMALQFAQGEYLGFVDSDDWVDETMYEEMYLLAKEKDADIVICDMVDHYPDHDVYHHASQFTDKFSVTPSACNKIFRRSFVEDVRFPEGLWYEDFEFTTKLLMKTEKIDVIHKGFYHCHCREVSTMNNNNAEKNKDILTVMKNLETYVIEKNWQDKYSDVLEYLYLDHILITTLNRLENQHNRGKRSVIKFLRKEVCKKYPHFYKGKVFKSFSVNRKIVLCLNAVGLSGMSRLIFYLKSKL